MSRGGSEDGGLGRGGLTRRALAQRSGVAALALGSGSTLAGLLGPGTASAQSESTDPVIARALGLENALRVVYGVAERSGRLDKANEEMVRVLGSQNRVRVRLLARLLTPNALTPRPPRASEVPGLTRVSSQNGYLSLALGFENQTYLAYLDALGGFGDEGSVLALAQLAAGTAQHKALLRRSLGRTPAPAAFETGTSL